MRWLLIALLLILQVQIPVVAQAAPASRSCHAMTGEAPASDHGTADDDAMAHRAHLCPGCSIPCGAPALDRQPALAGSVPVAGLMAHLQSLAAPPSIPPPRMS